ncbi:MAG TPA: pseudouridine synthase [Microbacteriaceae bacterium]|nr:pseudouridine synthase [Microbacteriaceae bacterium]
MSRPDAAAEGERLQKVLAAAGVASRRVVEQYIAEGRVTVDGRVAELGQRVTIDQQVEVDGTPIQLDTAKRYVVLNKPTGVVSSMSDDRGRRDLTEFTRDYPDRLYNVGRLDFDTSGLLLLTNDGELAHVLAHPSFGVEKMYVAKVRGKVQHATITRLKDGVELEDGPIAADGARVMGVSGDTSLVEITLHSGRNRIVRRMLDEVGHPVLELVRRQFGPLRLGSLGSGRSREVTPVELGALLKLVRKAERRAAHEAREDGTA